MALHELLDDSVEELVGIRAALRRHELGHTCATVVRHGLPGYVEHGSVGVLAPHDLLRKLLFHLLGRPELGLRHH